MWEGLKCGRVLAGFGEGYSGSGKEGCVVLISEKI